MTPHQVNLEYEHLMLDRIEKGEQVYTDDEYDAYDNETDEDEVDKEIADTPTSEDTELPKSAEIIEEEDWEDVSEIPPSEEPQ